MRLPLFDETARFSCGSCTACCNQPWRTMIEAEKALALDQHDWSAYPQLRGRRLYHNPADGRPGFHDLAKGDGNRCVFLDTDGLCIIHKELGPEAKPAMCRQFPFLSSRTWTDDRISLNFGCPSVQQRRGQTLTEQQEDIRAVTPNSNRPHKGSSVRVPLDLTTTISHEMYDVFIERACDVFDEAKDGDIWSCFVTLLDELESMRDSTAARRATGNSANSEVPAATEPLSVRMLFAATLFPDTLPAGRTGQMGFLGRLTLMPRLLALARWSGGYASRILDRNISIDTIMAHSVESDLDPESSQLLRRYYRSRLWQRWIVGTRLPIIGGLHQHICDLNAILFLARAEAQHAGVSRLSAEHLRKALTGVEFHLANQSRLYEQVLKEWLKGRLCDVSLARRSLRIFAPAVTSSPQ